MSEHEKQAAGGQVQDVVMPPLFRYVIAPASWFNLGLMPDSIAGGWTYSTQLAETGVWVISRSHGYLTRLSLNIYT